jgi:hypothetical protein
MLHDGSPLHRLLEDSSMKSYAECDFPHILATFVKDIVAEPLVQKPVESKQVLNKCVGYCGSDSNGCSISWQ